MEGHRVSKKAVSAYDDVFGGPPRFAAPFAARLDDYAEIFGGAGSACSIPFLDLPPAMNGLDGDPAGARGGSGFDYSEVFGSLDFGEFAVPYEELFASPRSRVEVASSDGRVPEYNSTNHKVTDESEFSLEDMNEGHTACVEEDGHHCFSSNSNHSEHDPKHANLSYNRISPDSKDGAMTGTEHISEPPGIGSVIDRSEGHEGFVEDDQSCFLLNSNRSENNSKHSNLSFNRTSLNNNDGAMSRTMDIPDAPKIGSLVDTITPSQDQKGDAAIAMVVDYKSDGKLQGKLPSNLSGDELKTPRNELSAHLQSPASNSGHGNLNHHSHSSSSNSISSEDASSSNVMYVSVSDISLRTQPLRVPPPSRPPPKILHKKDHAMLKTSTNLEMNHDKQSSSKPNENPEEDSGVVIPKIQARQDAAKVRPFFFDVDVDASSAAAAMKEAMVLAEARLRSAKELMGRKHVNFQNRKKLGDHGNKNDRKVDQSSVEVGNISEMPTQKIISKDDRQIDGIAPKEINKVTNLDLTSPDIGETERHIVMPKYDQQMIQGSNLVPEDQHVERRMNQEHYEVTKREKKRRTIGDVPENEGTRKQTKAITNKSEDNHYEHKEATTISEFEGIKNLKGDSEKGDKGEIATSPEDDNITCEKEADKTLDNTVLVASLLQKDVNDLKDAHVSSSGENDNLGAAQNIHNGEMRVLFTISKNTTLAISEENLEMSDNHEFQGIDDCKDENSRRSKDTEGSFKCEGSSLHDFDPIHVNLVENIDSKSAEVAFKSGDIEKDFASADVNSEEHVNENILNACTIDAVFDKKEMKMSCGSSVGEVGEDLNSINNIKGNSANPILQNQVECDQTDNLVQLVGSRVAIMQESKELTQESCLLGKIESGLDVDEVIQVADEVSKDLNILKAKAAIAFGEQGKLKATEVAFSQDCNEINIKEIQVEEKRSDKIREAAVAAQVPCMLANSEKQNICGRNHEVNEKEEIKDIRIIPDVSDNIHNLNTVQAQDAYQNVQSKERGDISESAQVSAENFNMVSEKIISNFKKIEEREDEKMERERIWAEIQARKLEEEKEREREREKDRLAVERATREARERTFAESRERAERIAVERVTAEARQRALKEAREKAEKASAPVDKSQAEKASREARLRAERAAVERATSEARERAAEKAAADARERIERSNGSHRDRIIRENLTEEHFRARNKEGPSGVLLQSTGSSSTSRGYATLNNQSEGESALRCKARLERHQRTAERVAKALAEKNTRDILAQREQAERSRLSEYLDADVKRWSNGKEGNLRALLSTLQYILGSESGWQPISLTDVITAAAVKKSYRKATLCVHPDKLQQRRATIQQKYICEKVFDLLKVSSSFVLVFLCMSFLKE
ncbi:auxilin-like protein 1 isoform X2 [Canna indica]|uniref:Auxilin-like protein 1 isoform X2 n=1 Tax=Canna indica TaxID=4628 RepID=A0AAQ3JKZ2_9LILI|nr:auxilin-like protein 1 isoform X2 [Canna indica]